MTVWVKISKGKVIDSASSENQAKEKETQNFLTDTETFLDFVTAVYSSWELAQMIFNKTTNDIQEAFEHDLDLEALGWQKIEIKN